MKKSKKLKNYILKHFIIISLAIMILSNIIESIFSESLSLVKNHYKIIENEQFIHLEPRGIMLITVLVLIYTGAQLGMLYYFLRLYGNKIDRRLSIPVSHISTGLEKIMNGDLSARLDFKADNEFVHMRDTFNYMAVKMQEAESIKKTYETERSLLFSHIAHDLRTPITTITGYAQALSDGVVVDDDKQKEYLKAIYAKSLQMTEVLELLFTYTKLDNKQYVMQFEKTDIVELMRSILATAYTEFEYNQLLLEIDLPDDIIMMDVDRFEMNRAIMNLLSNAIKHNPPLSQVLFKLENQEGLRIIIADNGPEIPKHIVNRLFDPFVLGDESRNSMGGSGLGLAITKKIIEKHCGEIVLEPYYQAFTKAFIITF